MFIILLISGVLYEKYQLYEVSQKEKEDYDLIKQFLLNENVVIEETQIFPPGLLGSQVVVLGKSLVLFVEENSVTFAKILEKLNGSVLAGIVNDQDLVIELTGQSFFQLSQASLGVLQLTENGNDYANGRNAHDF